ncbi:glycosyltransferase [Ornithinimicrobium tianjinense]|uniref:D-inositol 3-phosphate glycosyltransferase n=1 Tax=Ornithinimicrobium tianjinense TaxID=1195761 RepID=A0A917F2T0_9MICO|nr:glycosyltransferase [Ornithinimicrobium tianjinense]GGF39246.1 glycosyl transferase [Ornithinimicrobium tianjinense]
MSLVVNMASESDVSVQGHGVHTAYVELATALERRDDVSVVRGRYGERVDCGVYHLHTLGTRVWRKLLDPRAPTVVSAHVVPDSLVGSLRGARWWRPAARLYMRWFYRRADTVLAVSGTVARALESELGVDPDRIEVLYNTIDMAAYRTTTQDRIAARRELGFRDDAFVVLGVGQVQPRKRVDLVDRLAREHPEMTFVWVGGIPFKHLGADYGAMRSLMDDAPDNLVFTDMLPHPEVRRYLQAADVFCLPAEQENHPMCILEAAGVGLPVVARDIPEYDDTFGDDVLRCRDETFGEALVHLREDETAYRTWAERSRRIADRFDSAAAAERLVGIYRELVAARVARSEAGPHRRDGGGRSARRQRRPATLNR